MEHQRQYFVMELLILRSSVAAAAVVPRKLFFQFLYVRLLEATAHVEVAVSTEFAMSA